MEEAKKALIRGCDMREEGGRGTKEGGNRQCAMTVVVDRGDSGGGQGGTVVVDMGDGGGGQGGAVMLDSRPQSLRVTEGN